MTDTIIIEITEGWIRDFVIKLNLCPFAFKPFKDKSMRYKVEHGLNDESRLTTFWKECNFLLENDERLFTTSFIIFPNSLESFTDYLDFLELCEALMESEELEDFALVSFHPHYLFEGDDPEEVANFTNRSPYPMIQILRNDYLDKAIDAYGDTTQIWKDNITTLRNLGMDEVLKILGN